MQLRYEMVRSWKNELYLKIAIQGAGPRDV